ncbi:amidohydrolase family protein [Kutzneria sp. CA-103260]|uniref:amidohydrolase family protein n=1 Tax=Kutzneria sp. CA-103260 TaxID=2802641 RepID=UPI001BA6138C|nr:amidohydrolase family protein [Kutzneria sp. CA-103260]QUQ67954.1 amidohydrolase [Kutzneria sp. CA-103260]
MAQRDPWLDVHAHFVTERYLEQARANGHAEPDGWPTGLPSWSVDEALELMAATGVGAAVLSVSSPGVHFGDDAAARDLARHVNEAGAEIVAANPSRFGLSVSLPLPDVDGALAELAYGYDTLHADAVALKTNFHGRYLADPAFEPVLAEMNRRGAVVTLHPTSAPCSDRTALGYPRPMIEFLFDTTRCVIDLAMSGTLARHPDIRWIVPHAGAVLPVLAHRVAGIGQITGKAVDMPAVLGGLYYDLAGMPLPVALDALLQVASPDRLLYGSDFPFTPSEAVTALAAALRESPAVQGAPLAATAAELFPRLGGAGA